MKNASTRYLSVMLLAFSVMVAACSGGSKNNEADDMSKMDETEATAESNNSMADNQSSDTANKTVDGKLNINTATSEAFQTIPDVGDKMVHEFEEYRPYVSIQQFRREIGKYVDESQVAAYEKYIYVPVHRNDSDMATLLQVPGLDEDEAKDLISGRPYETNQAFADALSKYVSKDELAVAQGFMKSE